MKRRDFSTGVVVASLTAGGVISPAIAQGDPVEGKDYVRLSQPLPVQTAGKVEVIEFFWYGCPHCNVFEPSLHTWVEELPADVAFRRVPVAFRESWDAHQRIFFSLEEMKLVETMHRKVFYAIHNDRQRLDKPAKIAEFMVKHGVDGPKFLDYYNAFSVRSKARQAIQLAQAYKIDGVPAIGVQGKYFTSVSMAGTPDRVLKVADFLIHKSRATR